jgi:DNA-directed RNA polymerase subunit F
MAAEAFAALNRILENRQRRESADRQYALALMQFDYQKKQADMVQVGKQLELLQGANAQMMNNVAQNFMSESGLDMIYNAEDKGGEDAMKELKDLGFSKNHAAKVVSAVWAYHAQNPQPILKLGRELKNIYTIDLESLTGDQQRFAKALGGLVGLNGSEFEVEKAKELLNRTDKILQNQDDIMSEVYEYGTGDFEIQRKDIGLGLQQLAKEAEAGEDDIGGSPMVSIPTPKEMLSQSQQSLKIAEDEYETKQNALNILDTESMTLKELQRKGTLTDIQREYLARIPKMKDVNVQQLADLNEDISKAKEELRESRGFEAEVKLSEIMKAKRKSTGGHYSPY